LKELQNLRESSNTNNLLKHKYYDIFKYLDSGGKGYLSNIDMLNFGKMIGLDSDEIYITIKELDTNGDNKIQVEEWICYFQN